MGKSRFVKRVVVGKGFCELDSYCPRIHTLYSCSNVDIKIIIWSRRRANNVISTHTYTHTLLRIEWYVVVVVICERRNSRYISNVERNRLLWCAPQSSAAEEVIDLGRHYFRILLSYARNAHHCGGGRPRVRFASVKERAYKPVTVFCISRTSAAAHGWPARSAHRPARF